jgi:hypothetical protein
MFKYTKRSKLKVIKQYLGWQLGYHRLSAQVGIPAFTIWRWESFYEWNEETRVMHLGARDLSYQRHLR